MIAVDPPVPSPAAIGAQLRFARQQARLNLRQVEALTGELANRSDCGRLRPITPSSLSRYERGEQIPSLLQALALCHVYQRDLEELIARTRW